MGLTNNMGYVQIMIPADHEVFIDVAYIIFKKHAIVLLKIVKKSTVKFNAFKAR